MAHLAHSALLELRRTIREGRSVIVVGPARTGVSLLVSQQLLAGVEPVATIGLRNMPDIATLCARLAKVLGLDAAPTSPADLQVALSGSERSALPSVLVVSDCHRGTPACLDWLLQAALDNGAQPGLPFVFEGGFDPDHALNRALPDGFSQYPLVHYCDPSLPWRTLAQVEEILRGRWRHSFTEALIPWMADLCGGDVGLLHELLERLPNDAEISDATLAAAIRKVVVAGARAREIREAVQLVGDGELLLKAASGAPIKGLAPSVLEESPLKRAYLTGLLSFDGVAGAYRVRGPIAAAILAPSGDVGEHVGRMERRFILARLLTFFVHIASFELDLRSAVRPHGPEAIAATMTLENNLGPVRKKIKEIVNRIFSPSPEQFTLLNNALRDELPEQNLLQHIRSRTPGADEASILEEVTFSQLAQMARSKDVFSPSDDALVAEIGKFRNAFAHFRAEGYARCQTLLTTMASARRKIRVSLSDSLNNTKP